MDKVRVALVGIGVMGSKYAQMIVSGEVTNMILAGVVARKPEARVWAETLISKEGVRPNIYSDVDDMFVHADDYDAVIIVTPHKTHEEIALRAFELGKHVLCDKPAGASISQAENMTAAAKRYDRVYGMIFHQHRYPKYMYIKNALDNGELGELKRMMVVNSRYFRTAHYHKSGSWRSSWNGEGGGALINQGAHILDIWQWFFGLPKKLYADIPFGKYNEFQVDDEATVHMSYDGGVTGVFMLTTGEAVWQERFEIVGTKGRMLLEDDTLHIQRYSMDSQEYIRTQHVNSRENLLVQEEVIEFGKAQEPYVAVLENFAESVLDGGKTQLFAPGEQAVNQLMLTNAAYYSAWSGCPVELPLDAAIYDRELEKRCEAE